MVREREIDLTALTDWVLEQGLGETTMDTLVTGIGEQLNAAGIPVIRSHLSVAMLHPRIEARSCSWWRDDGVTETGHELGSSEQADWQGSPLAALLESRQESLRCRICDGEGLDRFSVMQDFAERGGTDYLSFVVGFGDGQTAIDRRDGMLRRSRLLNGQRNSRPPRCDMFKSIELAADAFTWSKACQDASTCVYVDWPGWFTTASEP